MIKEKQTVSSWKITLISDIALKKVMFPIEDIQIDGSNLTTLIIQ